jgi:hypothetical protein
MRRIGAQIWTWKEAIAGFVSVDAQCVDVGLQEDS